MLKVRRIYIMMPLTLIIMISLMRISYIRNFVYKNPMSMWRDDVIKSPNKRRAHENLGQSLSAAGLYQEALKELTTVLALKDDGSVPMRDVYREIGVVYYRVGRIDDSIIAWQKGLRFAPNDAGLLNNLSVAYLTKQSYDEAEAHALAALNVDPLMPSVMNTLGEVYLKKGKAAEAATYFIRAIEREPDVPARYWNAALALAKGGNIDNAILYAERFLAMSKNEYARRDAMDLLANLKKLKAKKTH